MSAQAAKHSSECGVLFSLFLKKKKKKCRITLQELEAATFVIAHFLSLIYTIRLMESKDFGGKKLIEMYLCGCSIKSNSCSSRMKVTPKPQKNWFRFGQLNSFFFFLLFYPTSTAMSETKFAVFQVFLSFSL